MSTRSARLPTMYTVKSVADLLGVSEKTVRRLLKAKQLASHAIGRQIRISEEHLHAFLATHGRHRDD